MEEKRSSNHGDSNRRAMSLWLLRHKKARSRRVARSLGRDYRREENRATVFKLAALLTFLVLGISTIGGMAFSVYSKDLPSPEMLASRKVFQSVRILDRNGVLLYEAFDPETGRRTSVPLDTISQNMIMATLAIEDASFFENPGFDIKGVVRAAMLNAASGRIVSGGSTITQQVARNALLADKERQEQTLSRKAKEAILAFQINQEFSKEKILETYLNEVYYGNMAYGVEAAAYTYFGKHASDLTLAESAMIAGFVSAPSDYDPYLHPEVAKKRQSHVLDLLAKHKFVEPEVVEQARQEELKFVDPLVQLRAPHFVMYVREELEKKFGKEFTYTSGLVVTTTLDYDLQQAGEKIVKDRVATFKVYGASNAALVSLDPHTGGILAMVGSADYYDDKIDGSVNVTTNLRSPGSSIKPIMYVAAFARGFSPSSIVLDSPGSFAMGAGTYTPRNYDGGFRGPITIRRALAGSLNVPAIRTLNAIGVPAMIEQAKQMGITTFKPNEYFGLPLTVGGVEVKILEEVGAYSVFAAQGVKHDITPFLTITDGKGNNIQTLDPRGTQVIEPARVYLITSILTDNDSRAYVFGPNSPLILPDRPVAAKTGTSENLVDFLTMGFTPDVVTGVWVGNTDGRKMSSGDGVNTAAKIWHDFMVEANKGLPVKQFERPPGVVEAPVCEQPGGKIAGRTTDVFIEGQVPVCQPKPQPAAPAEPAQPDKLQ
ncbi:MAG: PBP1A family penicillin-binding protein [Chloroflexi bacterium]|nr:PBP1A family penicillin-binding protein [Chloroflexota bacterium]